MSRPSDWTTPRYPGDSVKARLLVSEDGRDIGEVRIQDYGHVVTVACFLPGHYVLNPGDTPKTEPEWTQTFTAPTDYAIAERTFKERVSVAIGNGWQEYRR